ncbi:hypothetical protein PsAD2_01704 [Pseudovibrio axinellae]|uniref:Uncharacterized protein n=1 Tax=Pseudovibrio axinellae TaxID=989403 RepID=A0A165ZGR2_9HYPH|nr:hypothetical protein PsAD2_01704 [Pseudovibrio axinellae]SER38308.1 hypothetical protein SAMN05421798_10960 [Pseudovibrio axinellae]
MSVMIQPSPHHNSKQGIELKILDFLIFKTATLTVFAVSCVSATSSFAQPAQNDVTGVVSSPKMTTHQHGDCVLVCYDPAINSLSCQIKQRVVHFESSRNILQMMTYNSKDKSDIA